MATCFQCKTQETNMYQNGVPICLACATDKAANITRMPARAATANGKGNLPEDLKRSG